MSDEFDATAREIATADSWRYSNAHGCQVEEGFLADLIASALRSAVKRERERAETKWMLAQKALNQIDDGFEYRFGDEKARTFVQKVLADYTASIRARGEN